MKLIDYTLAVIAGISVVAMVAISNPKQKLNDLVLFRNYVVNKMTYKGTYERALEIRGQLVKFSGNPRNIPYLYLHPSKSVNAMVNPIVMLITQGMLDHVNSDDEIAYVLAHETAHVMLGHTNPLYIRGVTSSAEAEANSDRIAVYLMLRAGYDPCKAKGIWKRLRDKHGDRTVATSHPNYSTRIHQLSFPVCGSP